MITKLGHLFKNLLKYVTCQTVHMSLCDCGSKLDVQTSESSKIYFQNDMVIENCIPENIMPLYKILFKYINYSGMLKISYFNLILKLNQCPAT